MVVSNEPGYYEDGAFGIRIENLLVRRPACSLDCHHCCGTRLHVPRLHVQALLIAVVEVYLKLFLVVHGS